jgi:hypothetical protein
MSKTTMKTLRFVVPGVMVLTVATLLFRTSLQELRELLGWVEGLVYLVVVLPVCYVYYVMNVRRPFLKGPHSRIDANIKKRLTAPFRTEAVINENIESLSQGRRLVNLFYSIVDKDESLKSKTQDVYLNGLLLSSTADLMAVSLLFVPVYVIAYFVRLVPHYLLVALGLCIVYLFAARVAMPRITSRHIELSNDQLDFMLEHHSGDVRDGLVRMASEQPAATAGIRHDPGA